MSVSCSEQYIIEIEQVRASGVDSKDTTDGQKRNVLVVCVVLVRVGNGGILPSPLLGGNIERDSLLVLVKRFVRICFGL